MHTQAQLRLASDPPNRIVEGFSAIRRQRHAASRQKRDDLAAPDGPMKRIKLLERRYGGILSEG
jgi:hypothetical protein